MSHTGKYLETLVREIEKFFLPKTFQVEANERVFDDEGNQIAEFDITIRGRFGSTNISWLIECRDRPGGGSAPGSWIEQLVGRRERFGFNKVTAVSTTGFAPGAIQWATRAGIELRTVEVLTAENIRSWCLVEYLAHFTQGHCVEYAELVPVKKEPKDITEAFAKVVLGKSFTEPILRSTETGKLLSVTDVAQKVIMENRSLYDDVEPNGAAKKVRVQLEFPDESSQFVVETEVGDVQVTTIILGMTLSINTELIPIERIARYAHYQDGEPIADTVSFKFEINENSLSVEFYKLVDTGETHVILRNQHL